MKNFLNLKIINICRYKKLFLRLVDLSLFNAYTMMKTHHPKLSFLNFRLNLIRQVLQITGGTTKKLPPSIDNPIRFSGQHFLQKNPATPKLKNGMRRCYLCSKTDYHKRTTYSCDTCNVPLCVTPCFKNYHTKNNI